MSIRPYADVRAALPNDALIEVNGQSVHIERRGFEHATTPLLLLHGFGESTQVWRLVLPELAKHRPVVAVDLTGFGYTQRPRELAAYTYGGQTRMLLGLLDQLGLGRVDVAGHSYGGGLALFLAGKHPDRVGRLVLINNTLPVFSQARRSPLARFRTLNRLALATFLRPRYVAHGLASAYHDDRLVTAELVETFLERLAIEGVLDAYQGLSAPLSAELSADPAEQPPELLGIDAPALVIWGEHDRLIELEVGRRNAARLPNARFEVLTNCGHVPPEEQPAELLALMLPFLAEHSLDFAAAAETVEVEAAAADR